jgi:hypothetical protein
MKYKFPIENLKIESPLAGSHHEFLYDRDLSGPEFRQKVEAVKEGFVAMQKDLNEEKRIFEKR